MVLRDLLVRQNQKRFLSQTLHHCLGDLRRTQNPIESCSAAIGATQHGRVDRLWAQAAHFDPVVAMRNGQRLSKSDRRMLGRGISRCIGLCEQSGRRNGMQESNPRPA